MGLFQKWGFGAELIFEGGRARAEMGRAQRAVIALRGSFGQLREAGNRVTTGLGQLGTLLAPLGLGLGFAASKASFARSTPNLRHAMATAAPDPNPNTSATSEAANPPTLRAT